VQKQDCTCDFSNDAAEGGEDTAAVAGSRSEMLAAAAGAISPLLIGGAGLGIFKLLRKGGNSGIERQNSSVSETPPPPYKNNGKLTLNTGRVTRQCASTNM